MVTSNINYKIMWLETVQEIAKKIENKNSTEKQTLKQHEYARGLQVF